ncbi:MAG: flavin-containing monooxygenase [Alphaproteobacteria bacterium]
MTDTNVNYEALIVGTGFGGMGAAIQLKKLGIDNFLMIDRADDLGGTWHLNHYPGLQVDIPSVSYSYSFEPNPYWSRRYCPGQEIKKYANHVADKYGLRGKMQFNTSVNRATFDEAGQFWTVYPQEGAPITARFLLLATGFLSQPKKPDIDGVESFAGKVVHTAEWDHEYDFNGKRAAMIGTGASAVQALPIIAKQVAQMDVYQRTPIWVLPKSNPKISSRLQNLYARFPALQKAARWIVESLLETMLVSALLHARQLPFLARQGEGMAKKHLAKQVADPVLRQKLTPDYSFGCKRPTFANDYYPTFTKPNVELVTDTISHIEPDAIVTKDGKRRPIDTLILATGFNLWEKGNFPAFDVVGKQGVELGSWWQKNQYESYEGITVPGFPNLFNLHSPYSYSGLCYFSTIESQMAHMERCLTAMRQAGASTFEVTDAAKDEFMQLMDSRQKDAIFTVGSCQTANSYYFNPHGVASVLRLTPTRHAVRQAKSFPPTAYQFS